MLKYQPLVKQNPFAIDFEISGSIEFKNVYFDYPGTNVPVLKNLSLNIDKGDYVAFVGIRYDYNLYIEIF